MRFSVARAATSSRMNDPATPPTDTGPVPYPSGRDARSSGSIGTRSTMYVENAPTPPCMPPSNFSGSAPFRISTAWMAKIDSTTPTATAVEATARNDAPPRAAT